MFYNFTVDTATSKLADLQTSNILVCNPTARALEFYKDLAGTVKLFAVPDGIASIMFSPRFDLSGPLYAKSSANGTPIVINIW